MLLRGVNRQIIEINETDDIYFEKAVLYVRPEYADGQTAELQESARDFLKNLDLSGDAGLPWESGSGIKNGKKHRRLKKRIIGSVALSVAIVAGIAIILWVVL